MIELMDEISTCYLKSIRSIKAAEHHPEKVVRYRPIDIFFSYEEAKYRS
jgi:hypothetical protein